MRIHPDFNTITGFAEPPTICTLQVCLVAICRCPLLANSPPQAWSSSVFIVLNTAMERLSQHCSVPSICALIKNSIQSTIGS
jgi:hypothetical protein